MNKGRFITFEGGDGSGKSTQIRILHGYLRDRGHDVVLTREPGGTDISEKIRDIILDRGNAEMFDMTEVMLYAAARAQLVREVIKPAVERGSVVICDRFADSSMAYQAYGRGLGEAVWEINRHAIGGCVPDMTILLKLDPTDAAKRIRGREHDRIEAAPSDFHRKVHEGYLALERRFPERIRGIDAGGSVEEIADIIKGLCTDELCL